MAYWGQCRNPLTTCFSLIALDEGLRQSKSRELIIQNYKFCWYCLYSLAIWCCLTVYICGYDGGTNVIICYCPCITWSNAFARSFICWESGSPLPSLAYGGTSGAILLLEAWCNCFILEDVSDHYSCAFLGTREPQILYFQFLHE